MAGFTYWGRGFSYETGGYNDAALNERAVEVPIASAFVDESTGEGLEVGRVLAHYRSAPWTTVDRFEPGATNVDVFDWHEPADWIVAVSTLEHVRWDVDEGAPHEPGGAERALRHLLGLLRPGGRMLVTAPMGTNPAFDSFLLAGRVPGLHRGCTFVRNGPEWVQTRELTWRPYGSTTLWAESVWVGEFGAGGRVPGGS